MPAFSNRYREEYEEQMQSLEFDLLVIGGGITGAGIALDAQTRGLRAALLEMQDFAAGTSSRSTKLVHGGLRYLKQMDVGLVAEVGKERAIVYENGPHVTSPEWMLLPIIDGGTYGKLTTSIGLYVYDRLAGVKRTERRRMLGVKETKAQEPLLRTNGLRGSGFYVEYRTDDARLTLEVLKAAISEGAVALNYAKVTELLYEGRQLVGVFVEDLLRQKTFRVRAKKIVNATGPWVDALREIDGSKRGKYVHHTKGVHIVVDRNRMPLSTSVYFDTPDGRMVFAIPRENKTYIGTTDTNYTGDLEHPRVTMEDCSYLVRAVNSMFPDVHLTVRDVESSWAGIRPLIHEEGKSPSEISRKDEIFLSDSGLITIAGGKLTGYRKMAEKVVDLVSNQLHTEIGTVYAKCTTHQHPISGGEFGRAGDKANYDEVHIEEGMKLGLTTDEARRLVRRYGTNSDMVFDYLRNVKRDEIPRGMSLEVYAALCYAIEHEMTATPTDFFLRRTGAILFDITGARRFSNVVVAFMQERLNWSDEATLCYRRELLRAFEHAAEVT